CREVTPMLLGKRWLVPALVGGAALAYAYHRGTAHGHADGERHERSHGHADGERHERSDGHGHGRQRYSARNATLYDAVTAPVLGGFFTWAAQDLAALAPRARVLEVGSGPGRLAAKLAALAPEVQVTGVDIAPEMVARANALAARSGVADRVAF